MGQVNQARELLVAGKGQESTALLQQAVAESLRVLQQHHQQPAAAPAETLQAACSAAELAEKAHRDEATRLAQTNSELQGWLLGWSVG